MGLFDSLIFSCPMCGKTNEEQTKDGPSCLDVFYMDSILPTWIMESFNGAETICTSCGKKLRFVFDLEIKVKDKKIVPTDNLDTIELAYREKEKLQNLNKSAIIKKRGKKRGK